MQKLVQNKCKKSIKLEDISEVQKIEVISTPESTNGAKTGYEPRPATSQDRLRAKTGYEPRPATRQDRLRAKTG